MLAWLAGIVAGIGAALNGMGPRTIEPSMCSQHGGVNYCYYVGSPNSHKVIYFMHGFGNDVTGWTVNSVTYLIEKNWKDSGAEQPHIVSIDKGVWWYTDAREGQQLNAFTQWFEQNQLKFEPTRILYGDSMGGHDALRWSLDNPQMFSRVALICPALPRWWVQNPAPSEGNPTYQWFAEQLIAEFYNGSSQPQFNPIAASVSATALSPRYYIVDSNRDDFGFFAADEALIQSLGSNAGTMVEHETQSITHCNAIPTELSKFLLAD